MPFPFLGHQELEFCGHNENLDNRGNNYRLQIFLFLALI